MPASLDADLVPAHFSGRVMGPVCRPGRDLAASSLLRSFTPQEVPAGLAEWLRFHFFDVESFIERS
jgi:hypothetical protein